MSFTRSESRTEQGWQHFDRTAALVSFAILLLLLVLTLMRADILPSPFNQESGDVNVELAAAPSQDSDPSVQDSSAQDGAPDNTSTDNVETPAAEPDPAAESAAQDSTALVAAMPSSKEPAEPADAPVKADTKAAEVADEPADKENSAGDDQQANTSDADVAAEKTALDAQSEQAEEQASDEQNKVGIDAGSTSMVKRGAPFDRIPTHIQQPISAHQPEKPIDEKENALVSAAAAAPSNVEKQPKPAISKVKPILELRVEGGKVTIDGIVSDEQTRKKIVSAALSKYGMRNLTDRLGVSNGVERLDWADQAEQIVVLMGAAKRDATVRVDGHSVVISGSVDSLADKQARALQAQQLFGTRARVDNQVDVVAVPAKSKVTQTASLPKSLTTKQAAETAKPNKTPLTKPKAETPKPVAGDTSAAPASGDGASDKSSNAVSPKLPEKTEVVLAPTPVPEKFALADCARIATGIRLPFASGKAALTVEGQQLLTSVKRCLSRRRYIVGGHTDSKGSAISNLILSQSRAQSAVDYLVSLGVPKARLVAKGYGETKPVDTNKTDAGRARNRRIDFRFDR